MQFEDVINKRRTHRAFSERPVERSIVKKLIEAGAKAPVSCNLQLTKYIVIDDEKLIKKLSKKVSYKFAYSPCAILVLHDSRFSVKRNSGVVTAAMAAENILLKATELGLGSCPMSGFRKDKKIKSILHIPDYFDLVLLISVGYPNLSEDLRLIPKIPISSTYSFNIFDNNVIGVNSSDKLIDHSISDIINYRSRISPVYLDRFRLKTWSERYYSDVAKFFEKNILPNTSPKNILDVMSYDGEFLKNLHSREVHDNIEISSSDYLENTITYFSDIFGYSYEIIDEHNSIGSVDKKYDMQTFVFQASFTPELEKLVRSMREKVTKDGFVFVAIASEVFYKRALKRIVRMYKKFILREPYNIYEGNPFYKIGPKTHMAKKKLLTIFKKEGFLLEKSGRISFFRGRGIKLSYCLFKK